MTDTTTAPDEVTTAEAVAPPRKNRFTTWLRNRDHTEVLVWSGLVAVALFLRLYDLGARPYHHDESQIAYFSYTFSKDFSSYEYNPLLHGPISYYVTAAVYRLFGDSDFTARLAPALFGTLLVAFPYLLRRQLGRVAAFGAGVMLAVSPSILYFSRFAREDIFLVTMITAITVTSFRFIRRPHALTLSLLGALVALAFGVKESGLVMVGLAGLFFLMAMATQSALARRRGTPAAETEVLRAVRAVGWTGWTYAVSTMLVTYAALFTRFFTHTHCTTTAYADHPAHPANCMEGVVYGLQYWHAQQDVARGADKAWLYGTIIVGNEWPILLLALVGVLFAFLRPTTLRLFLTWMCVTTLAFYCWGSERFSWLVIHPLVPMILLAGIGLQALWELRSRIARTAAMVAVAIGAVYLAGASYSANARQSADPRNLLVSTQSSTQVKQVADEVAALNRKAKAAGKPELGITIDSSQGATFPYAWYFRHDQVGYIDMTQANYTPATQVLIMTQEAKDAQQPNLSAYAGRKFDFRVWWVKDYTKKFSTGAWWRWFTDRRPWNPTGGLPEWFYLRRDAGTLPGKGTKSRIPKPPPVLAP